MAEATGQVTQFPSQSVDDATKSSKSYGMEVARGIQNEWFRKNSGSGRFTQNQRDFHKLRLYARGEQSTQKYKDEFSINGDLSYLNLDWKPVPIIPKFVDIVVNGMQDRLFKIKEDVYYFGEVKQIKGNELKKQFPGLSEEEFEDAVKKSSNYNNYDYTTNDSADSSDSNTLTVLYFNWKTWEKSVYKIKETSTGAKKAIKKDDTFDPPKDQRSRFEKVAQARETIYEGVMVLGANKLIKWEKASNMVRPDSNVSNVMMNYVVSAPRMYKGKIESLVSRMVTYADLIQLTHLKLQQTIQRMTPSGVYLDADGLAEIDLGNGTNYNPQEALNMYFQTGSVIGRSMTVDGELNNGKVPIQELPGGGGQQTQLLIQAYNYYLNMIRDVTGLNEARDGSDPDPYALVGVQKACCC